MVGVNGINIEEQLRFLKSFCSSDLIKRHSKENIHSLAHQMNGEGGFGRIEADALFCFISKIKPSRIIQIGAGLSTAVTILAAEESKHNPFITAIDPYPNKFLINADYKGKIKLVAEEAQKLPLSFFDEMEKGDFLFIDSTHTIKPGSEVNFLILEILPRLKSGVYVHFHDIYFPYDYKRDILSDGLFFSNESVLLHAFLCNNSNFRIVTSLSMIHYALPEELKKCLPNYIPQKNEFGLRAEVDPLGHFPSSTYLQKISE